MKLAIIGAGEGSRLQAEGIRVPKPLVPINGVPIIERIIRIAQQNNIECIHLIVNDAFGIVKDYVASLHVSIPIQCRLLSTPSSMHTLFALQSAVGHSPFCLTTVDSIFNADEFASFLAFCRQNPQPHGILAVTDFIDDEKPLCVTLDEENTILAFHDSSETCTWATGGIYYFSPLIFNETTRALNAGMTRLRNFLRLLIDRGYLLKAFPFSKIIDVDHAADIRKAEAFLNETESE
ncbi:MAG: nucleotidyltransferase family protein [Candidatus Omnitrophota bacterium]